MISETFDPQQKLDSLSFKKEIEKFSANLQIGDLGLSQIIPYGYILYGETRAGKTATGHILCGNSLRGIKANGEFHVQAVTSRNKKAKIGNSMNSETLVPNVFQVEMNEQKKKYFVIDTPGYGDTNGVLTIMANGYYHYRLYSKVQNMKFLLCFDISHLQNTAVPFLNTIYQWTNSFKNYLKERKQIWKSVTFIITKVDQSKTKKQDLVAKLRTIVRDMRTQYDIEVEQAIRQLIEFVIQQDRIFYTKKIMENQTIVAGDLLQQIDKKVPKWWFRQYDVKNKQVDMTRISFAVSEQIINSTTRSKKLKDQFVQLVSYYNIRINEFVQQFNDKLIGQRFSLSFVIQELINDAMDHPDSHKFLDVMAGYNSLYYKNYDQNYKEQRQKLEAQLFGPKNKNSPTDKSRTKLKGKDKNYLVKKFQCIKTIEELKLEINALSSDQLNLAWLQNAEHHLYEIIREFDKIAFKRSKAAEIIYKFGYLIHRIVEEAKVFILLVEVYGGEQNKAIILGMLSNNWIGLMVMLKDFMGVAFRLNKKSITYEELHLSFIKKYDFNNSPYNHLVINENFVDFFSLVDLIDEEDIEKQINLLIMYSDNVLQESQSLSKITLTKQISKLIFKLTNTRANCQATYDLKKKEKQKNVQMFLIRRTTKNLGKLLELLGQFELARKVYNTIRFVDSTCQLFRTQISNYTKIGNKSEQNKTKLFQLRMEFSKYLAEHFREYQAVEVLQQNYEQASNIQELKDLKQELTDLKLRMKEQTPTIYQQQIFEEDYFDRFDESLIAEIQSYSKNSIQ